MPTHLILDIALIVYTTAAFGIHGGEGITGLNRQFRNFLCALPFWLVGFACCGAYGAIAWYLLAFIGTNMGFNRWPLWAKGFITLPAGGFLALPLAYWIGNKTRFTNVAAEYLSGTFYGILLVVILCLIS